MRQITSCKGSACRSCLTYLWYPGCKKNRYMYSRVFHKFQSCSASILFDGCIHRYIFFKMYRFSSIREILVLVLKLVFSNICTIFYPNWPEHLDICFLLHFLATILKNFPQKWPFSNILTNVPVNFPYFARCNVFFTPGCSNLKIIYLWVYIQELQIF